MKTVKFTVPSFYKDFQCQADKCPANCCSRGWNIDVDKNTYELYRKVKDPEFKDDLAKYVKRDKKHTGFDNSYARIILDENGVCPLLKDGLCSLQRNLGYKYLPFTCKIFPRQTSYRLGSETAPIQTGLSMACREGIRLCFFSPDPVGFEEIDIDAAKNPVTKLSTAVLNAQNRPPFGEYALELQQICIAVMQSRNASIPDRIFVMGMLLNKLCESDNIADGMQSAMNFTALLISGKFNNITDTFSDNEIIKANMKRVIFETMKTFKKSSAFAGLERALTKRAEKDGKTYETLSFLDVSNYTDEFAALHWKGFLEKHSLGLENFFVSYIFAQSFPFYYEDLSVYHHFIILAEMYALIRLVFSAELAESGEISEDFLGEALSVMFQDSAHRSNTGELKKRYIEKGADSLAHMSFLLRK